MSDNSEKYAFASHSAMLLARFLDHYEVNRLSDSISDICHDLVGGRNAVQYSPEISLLSRALYYSCSILGFGITPGQALCGFTLVRPTESAAGKTAVSKAQGWNLYSAIILYTILPYVYERKALLWSNLVTMYDILITPENGISSGTGTVSTVEQQQDGFERPGEHNENNEVNNNDITSGVNVVQADIDSFLSKFLRALSASVVAIASSGSGRIEALCGFIADVHKLLFFQYGSYLEVPLRLAQLQLVSRSAHGTRQGSSLRALSWLLGFRISLLLYYSARVMLTQVDREMHRPPPPRPSAAPGGCTAAGQSADCSHDRTGDINNNSSSTGNALNSSNRPKCALCMDAMTSPAAIPCGHIYCWDCIVAHTRSNSSGSGGSSGGGGTGTPAGTKVKCPICRTEFTGQRVRALYNYF